MRGAPRPRTRGDVGLADDGGVVTVVEPDGGYLCAAAMGDNVTFGRTNATMPAECQGGWG
jgi:hypothetical protein